MKNTLPHIVNFEKTIFGNKNYLENVTWRPSRCDGVKISQSVIYVKEYFIMFFSTLKDIMQAQNKTNH